MNIYSVGQKNEKTLTLLRDDFLKTFELSAEMNKTSKHHLSSSSKLCSRSCRFTSLIFKPSQFNFTLCNMKNTDFLLEFLYNNETKDVKTLQAKTGLPLSTIYRKIKVLKEKGELKRNKGSGRPSIFFWKCEKSHFANCSQKPIILRAMKR